MAMPRIPGWFFIPTVVAIGTVATFSLLYIGGLPQLWPPPKFDYSQLKSEVAQEWRYATTDHEGIAHAIAACNKIFDLRSQPDYILSQLRIGVAPDGTYASMSDGGKSGEEYKFRLFSIMWAESKSLHNRLISFFSGCVHFAIQRPGVESA